jgi:hypothetical protein
LRIKLFFENLCASATAADKGQATKGEHTHRSRLGDRSSGIDEIGMGGIDINIVDVELGGSPTAGFE